MRSVIVFAVLTLVTATLVPRYLDLSRPGVAASVAVTPAASDTDGAAYRSMTITRGDNGHFSVAGEVDGRRMDFLVDTGASVVVLRERDAARLGIHPAAREYTVDVATANGKVHAAPVELNRVEVGPLTVRNVRALILPDEALSQNLLGMSFLSKVHWEHRNGRLVLEQ